MATRARTTRSGKSAGGRKGGKRSSRSSTPSVQASRRDVGSYLTEFSSRPVVKYVAGGLGLFVLGRIAMNFSDRYPQITTFFRENLDVIENKLSEFRGDRSDIADIGDEARH